VLILGHLELKPGWSFRVQDAGWDTPYLALIGSFAFEHKTPTDMSERSSGQRTVGLLIDNLSPVLFTLAITLMGVETVVESPQTGKPRARRASAAGKSKAHSSLPDHQRRVLGHRRTRTQMTLSLFHPLAGC
jgi:hypothetical protein